MTTVGVSAVLIPTLRRKRAGQPILEIGPAWHLSKAGTPTLGGLAFIAGIALAALIAAALLLLAGESQRLRALALVLLFAVLCGAIGFVDDYQKLTKKTQSRTDGTAKISAAAVGVGHLFVSCRGTLEDRYRR